MKRILITGGAGFIGYFLLKRLSEDKANDIVIADNLSRGKMDPDLKKLLARKNVSFVEGDLTERAFFGKLYKDCEYIYHLGAIIGVKNVEEKPDKVLYVNALSTLNVFEYARTIKSLKRVFFSSTSEVYAGTMKHFHIEIPTAEDVPLTVEDIRRGRTTYALSKIYGESTAFIYSTRYGIPITVGRFHNVYGPRMGYSHVIPESFVKIRGNKVVDVPSASHTRAFCFIDDAVEFTIGASESPGAVNETLHIGNPREEISIRNLVIKISDVMNKEIVINELPPAPGSPRRRCPDISRVSKLTGYAPRVAFEDGIRETYNWYKDKLDKRHEEISIGRT